MNKSDYNKYESNKLIFCVRQDSLCLVSIASADDITHADTKYQFQVNPIKPRSKTAGLAVH